MPETNKKRKQQYRKSFSVDPVTFIALKSYTEREGISMSKYVTQLICKDLMERGEEFPSLQKARSEIDRNYSKKPDKEKFSGIWTF